MLCEKQSDFFLIAGICELKINYSGLSIIGDYMQRFKKFIIVLTAVLMILSVPLAAAEMSVRWEWALDDPDVTMYRYQIGGEDPDGWTVLPQDTDSLEISGLDADSEYTLYLQRSYDGINWSPSATSTAKADVSQIPDVRLYRYGGYELRAEIMNGSAMLYYPETVSEQDAVDFIAYESEKYDLADSGITYSINGAGIAEFGYPDGISRDTAASELDVFVNDLVDYITAPKAIVQEPESVAEPIAEESAEPAVVREYEYAGYKLTATISSGKADLVYPSFITDDEVNTFFAVENAKYGLADLGVSYAFGGEGEVTINYPEAYSNEEAAAELDVLVEDLIAYLTPAPEPVVEEAAEEAEEPAVVREYEYAGYKLTAMISSGRAELVYPAFITDDEVNTFFAVENAKYGLADLGVSYAFGGAGEVTISYPEAYSNEEAAAELDVLVEDLIAYLAPAPVEQPAAEPVKEEVAAEPQPVLPIAPLTPVALPEEEDSPFAFSLLVRGGVASSFDTSFSFSDTIFAEAGLGFDFSRILPIGDHFGFGLRSDLLVDFVPKANGKWDLEDNLQYFNVFNYAEMTSIDLKLTMDIVAGPVDIYVGGGAGFAIGNPHDNSVISEYLQLGTFNIGSVRFSMDWFASAIAGIRFYIGDVFSIGAEVNYRYMVESNKHMGSADLVLGFTF